MATLQSLDKKIDILVTGLEQVRSGLELVTSGLDHLAIMTKGGFDELKEEMNNRFMRIENISIGGHERRIEHLEDGLRVIKTKLKLR